MRAARRLNIILSDLSWEYVYQMTQNFPALTCSQMTKKDTPSCHVSSQQEGVVYKPGSGPLPDNESIGTLISDLPASRTVRNEISVVYKVPSYNSPTKTQVPTKWQSCPFIYLCSQSFYYSLFSNHHHAVLIPSPHLYFCQHIVLFSSQISLAWRGSVQSHIFHHPQITSGSPQTPVISLSVGGYPKSNSLIASSVKGK
jgi:hypothetical protein